MGKTKKSKKKSKKQVESVEPESVEPESVDSVSVDSDSDSFTILSWDVGIINLAYSVIKFTGDKMELLDMDVIDVVDDRKTCCHIKRGGNPCEKVANHIFAIKERDEFEPKYYCKAHLKNADYEIEKCNQVIKCCKCKKNCHMNVTDTEYGWCEKHMDKNVDIYKRRCVRKFDQSCKKIPLSKITANMYKKLDKHLEVFMNVDQVLVELQPVLKNPMMKSVACALFSYFIFRGIHEGKARYKDNLIDGVKTVNASSKLKVDSKTTNEQLGKKGKKTKKNEKEIYDMTKGLGKTYARFIMNSEDHHYLEKHKKQDDMTDAFLQAIRYHYGNDLPQWIKDRLVNAREFILTEVKEKEEKKKKAKKKKETGITIDLSTVSNRKKKKKTKDKVKKSKVKKSKVKKSKVKKSKVKKSTRKVKKNKKK